MFLLLLPLLPLHLLLLLLLLLSLCLRLFLILTTATIVFHVRTSSFSWHLLELLHLRHFTVNRICLVCWTCLRPLFFLLLLLFFFGFSFVDLDARFTRLRAELNCFANAWMAGFHRSKPNPPSHNFFLHEQAN